MAARTSKVRAVLEDMIDILGKNATEAPPAKDIFETVCTILALVRVRTFILHPSADSQISLVARLGQDAFEPFRCAVD